jgi:hypothetical protein
MDVPGMYMIPRANPSTIQLWYFGPFGWTMANEGPLSSSDLEDWKGMIANNEYVNEATRVYVYSDTKVVEFNLDQNNFKAVGSANFTSGFVNNTLTKVTGAQIADGVLYISRSSKNVNLPGDVRPAFRPLSPVFDVLMSTFFFFGF